MKTEIRVPRWQMFCLGWWLLAAACRLQPARGYGKLRTCKNYGIITGGGNGAPGMAADTPDFFGYLTSSPES